jgi:hypothetical protein
MIAGVAGGSGAASTHLNTGVAPMFFEDRAEPSGMAWQFHGRDGLMFLGCSGARFTGGNIAIPGTPAVPRMRLVGATPSQAPEGEGRLAAVVNHLTRRDARSWRTNVPAWSKVRVREAYPGIDVVYYGNNLDLEYDFVVRPGGDPNRILLEFPGADDVSLCDNGDLSRNDSVGMQIFGWFFGVQALRDLT